MRDLTDRWRLLLVVSLALNLFVAGAVATAWLGGRGALGFLRRPAERAPRIVGMPNPRELRAALPEAARPALDATLRSHGPEIRQRIRGLGEARGAVAEAIRAEPFDRARLDAALARLREQEASVGVAAHGMVAELVEQLDPEGRQRVADLVPRRRGRR